MNKIIMFSGPAGCGKTTACEYVRDKYGALFTTFKDALYPLAFKYYMDCGGEFDYEEFLRHCSDRELKEKEFIHGFSPRGLLIHVSEKVIKPMYGKDFFGTYTANKILQSKAALVVVDVGFYEEYLSVYEKTKHEYDIYVIDIHREGCTFNDDRKYIGEMLTRNKYRVDNDGSEEHLIKCIDMIIISTAFHKFTK